MQSCSFQKIIEENPREILAFLKQNNFPAIVSRDSEFYSLLARLVHVHEVDTGYSLEELPQDFVEKEIRGTIGFAIDVTRIDAGHKLSQNRNNEDHENIILKLNERDDENSKKVAAAMRGRRNA